MNTGTWNVILNHVYESTPQEISQATDIGVTTVRRYLTEMKERGLVEEVGKPKRYRRRAPEPEPQPDPNHPKVVHVTEVYENPRGKITRGGQQEVSFNVKCDDGKVYVFTYETPEKAQAHHVTWKNLVETHR